jgi:sirohydrochlorin cobaltochelatase
MNQDPHSAVVLLAHGARDPNWAQPLEGIRTRLERALPGLAVRLAFLEFMPPTLDQAVAAVVADGARVIDVVPVFIARAGHVKRDLPLLVGELERVHPGVEIRLAEAVGEAEPVMDAIARWIASLVARASA